MFFKRRTTFSFLTAVVALCGFILLAWAIWSPHWVQARVVKDGDRYNTTLPLRQFFGTNPTDETDPGAFSGVVHFGLFRGYKRFNHGFGGRPWTSFSIYKEHSGVYATGIVIVVIILIFVALLFSLIATVFGLVNTLAVPIETIYGPVGLYLWNGLALAASGIAAVVYILLYAISMKEEILQQDDRDPPNNFLTDSTSLSSAYFLLLAACALFIINFIFIALAQYSHNPDAFKSKNKRDPNYNTETMRSDVGSGLIY